MIATIPAQHADIYCRGVREERGTHWTARRGEGPLCSVFKEGTKEHAMEGRMVTRE